MKVIEHIKEIISPGSVNADAWAAHFFPGPRQNVATRVVQIIVALADPEVSRLTDQTRLIEDLALNELQRVQLVLAVEEQFGIEISEQDAREAQTIGQFVECVYQKARVAEVARAGEGKGASASAS